jgi:two-component system, NtrC family, sensor histidine kinase HydH
MDLRTRTSLFCGALALAIAVSMLLRGKPQRAQWLFAAFSADIGLWYLAQWLYLLQLSPIWAHFTAVLVVALPQFAVHLFEALVPRTSGGRLLPRVAGLLFFPMLLLVLSPEHTASWVRGAVLAYVFGVLAAALWSLWRRGEGSGSRSTQKRVRFVVACGALATAFSLADFLWFVGVPLPPVGAVLSIVFVFVLAESLIRERLVDLYEMAALAVVSTALAFSLGGIFYVFVQVLGQFQTMYLNAVLGGIVMLMLFDPLREKISAYLHRSFFLERADLERAVERARQELTHVLQVERMAQVVINALLDSHRATAAALYLYQPLAVDFELSSSFGDKPPRRIHSAGIRALTERLQRSLSIGLEEVQRRLGEGRRTAEEAGSDEQVLREAELLGPYRRGVVVSVRARGGELLGLLLLVDERLSDAFSADERGLLELLARQISVVVENSRSYLQMQAQARLAALGQMAAGLAHEVKNPLSAIKGAAQLLGEPTSGRAPDDASSEFLGIILEEVERLDRVVRSVLDYARPKQHNNPGLVSVNAVVDQTLRLLSSDREGGCSYTTEFDGDVPRVRADAEQLRQVLLNLIRNAGEAMGGRGTITITTRTRRAETSDRRVEIAITDHGPGITPEVRANLFVPFFTTRAQGTGLGLAISERIVQEMGGRIEVLTTVGAGSTFSVQLPPATDSSPVAAP